MRIMLHCTLSAMKIIIIIIILYIVRDELNGNNKTHEMCVSPRARSNLYKDSITGGWFTFNTNADERALAPISLQHTIHLMHVVHAHQAPIVGTVCMTGDARQTLAFAIQFDLFKRCSSLADEYLNSSDHFIIFFIFWICVVIYRWWCFRY